MQTPSQADLANVYTDLNSLASLKGMSKKDHGQALDQVARQFESMLVKMMLASMRSANQVFSEGNPFESKEAKFYQDMMDQQLALSLSQSGGIGLADIIRRQLDPKAAVQADSGAHSLAGLSRLPKRIASEMTELAPAESETAPVSGPDAFVRELYPLAQRAARQLGVSPELLLSQAALETGWGEHQLRDGRGQPSNNFFNIKAGRDWQGPVVTVPALEYRDGVAVREWSAFRAYESAAESFTDYAALISGSGRYQQALSQAQNPDAYIRELAAAGYATDPDYADKVLAVMRSEPLQQAAQAIEEAL